MRSDIQIAGARVVFTEAVWTGIARRIAAAYRKSEDETRKLLGNKTARLVAALPFIAFCDEPERTALQHLSTFILASSEACRRAFDHKAEDDGDAFRRLASGADFIGGDRAMIDRGMCLLAIVMINGYKKDVDSDRAKGWYNPVGSGLWKADAMIAELAARADSRALSASMDEIMTTAEAIMGFWDD